jgi:hypothetical protein
MSYFATIENGLVTNIIKAEDDYAKMIAKELLGVEAVKITKSTRVAQIGYTYKGDKFIPPKPYTSWLFDEESGYWKAPVAYVPGKNKNVSIAWDEKKKAWVETPIIVETEE